MTGPAFILTDCDFTRPAPALAVASGAPTVCTWAFALVSWGKACS
ncbi:hypothetical protein SAMN04487912_105156 [Arthrobacter sp. cf158]|nr:hypothetical protein SAMN04487912_105156 [Arthrobacter sp. cf158]